ncbi:MAG: bifunctional precorrin-2 dehydrogenase/sirohydrochlorin ferrochelatase [Candidatus Omnitrophica bacterium]|nr:bifunctional precorrin-2 dehydrogenase/sirohydrochlorin ferrochelatase [Candidatus Omnitrophota bacterium]
MKNKNYYPVNLDLQGRQCLVVGGGDIAGHKVRALLECGALVTVISPIIKAGLQSLVRSKKICYIKDQYQKQYLKGVFLVIAATNVPSVNSMIAKQAAARNLLVNVVDVPDLCNFIVPAVIRRGPLVLGISTSGHSPLFAQTMKVKCEKCATPALGSFIKMMGDSRKEVQACCDTTSRRKDVYMEMINSPMLSLLEQGKVREARQTLHDIMARSTCGPKI